VPDRPRRHSKPRVSGRNGGADVRLVAAGGRADGLHVRDVVHAVTSAARIDGEAVRDVKVLQRFAFFSVPADEAERVLEAVDGVQVNGIALRVAPVPA
jgi:ATP-dependent RNA helicase DeaD